MRILQVLEPADGGVPAHVRVLSAGLVEAGHEVVVATRPETDAGLARHVALPFRGAVPAPREDVAVLRGLASLLHSGRFSLLHAHAQKAGLLGRVAARRAGVPALYTAHSLVYRTQAVRPRPTARIRARISLAMERRLGATSAALIGVSDDDARAMVRDRLAPADRVHAILNGVRVDTSMAPDPELLAFRGDGPLLGFVAGLRDQKGLPTLLDALAELRRRGEPVRMAIVGNGPLAGAVQAAAGDDTLVRPFAGRVEPYLAALDCFVLPSYWEGLPLAVLEAMHFGLPVVATAVGGTPEAVHDGETGWLVPPGDANALADALAQAARDAGARERFGAAGLRQAQDRFSADRMIAETEALYRAIAG